MEYKFKLKSDSIFDMSELKCIKYNKDTVSNIISENKDKLDNLEITILKPKTAVHRVIGEIVDINIEDEYVEVDFGNSSIVEWFLYHDIEKYNIVTRALVMEKSQKKYFSYVALDLIKSIGTIDTKLIKFLEEHELL